MEWIFVKGQVKLIHERYSYCYLYSIRSIRSIPFLLLLQQQQSSYSILLMKIAIFISIPSSLYIFISMHLYLYLYLSESRLDETVPIHEALTQRLDDDLNARMKLSKYVKQGIENLFMYLEVPQCPVSV